MNKLIILSVTCLFGILPIACEARRDCYNQQYYQYNSLKNKTAFVFDLKNGNVAIGNKNVNSSKNISSDIGGAFETCGNDKFYCWKSLVIFLIPKYIVSSTWDLKGNHCSSAKKDGAEYHVIICISHDGLVTRFTYFSGRGIISFQSLMPEDSKYVIHGYCGLFSSRD